MADLFESLLPEATPENWGEGTPGMGRVVSGGLKALYENLIRPSASPAGMAIGTVLGTAPKALAAAGGAALGTMGVAQGVEAAKEGRSALDVAIPIAMGAGMLVGMAAVGKSRLAKALVRGRPNAVTEEMLAIPEAMRPVASTAGARQMPLPMEIGKFSEGPPIADVKAPPPAEPVKPSGRTPTQREIFKTATQKKVAEFGEVQGETLPPGDPSRALWQARTVQMIDELADSEGLVDVSSLRARLKKSEEESAWIRRKSARTLTEKPIYEKTQEETEYRGILDEIETARTEREEARARLQPKSKEEKDAMLASLTLQGRGREAETKLQKIRKEEADAMKVTPEKRSLNEELETFGIRSSLEEYLRSNPGRDRFSAQELKAVGLLDSFMSNEVYGETVRFRGEPIQHGRDKWQEMRNRMWALQNIVGIHASAPMQNRETHFDLFVTFDPKVAERIGWAQWKDGHPFYNDVVNPIVRLRMGEYTTTNGRRALFLMEIQGPFEAAGDVGALNYPEFFLQRQRWMKIGARRALRYAAENGYDMIAWPHGRMIDAIQTPDFPLIRWGEDVRRPPKGVVWQKLQDGTFKVHSLAEPDTRAAAVGNVYTSDELYWFLGKQTTDQILQQAQAAQSGEVRKGVWEAPRPLNWTQKVYDKQLHDTMNEEGKIWREVQTGQKPTTSVVEARIDFPDDRRLPAWGEFPPEADVRGGLLNPNSPEQQAWIGEQHAAKRQKVQQLRQQTEGMGTEERFQAIRQAYPEGREDRPTADPYRWWPTIQLGVQPVWAIEVTPSWKQAPQQPGKGGMLRPSPISSLVPPAVGLGLAASRRSEEERQ